MPKGDHHAGRARPAAPAAIAPGASRATAPEGWGAPRRSALGACVGRRSRPTPDSSDAHPVIAVAPHGVPEAPSATITEGQQDHLVAAPPPAPKASTFNAFGEEPTPCATPTRPTELPKAKRGEHEGARTLDPAAPAAGVLTRVVYPPSRFPL